MLGFDMLGFGFIRTRKQQNARREAVAYYVRKAQSKIEYYEALHNWARNILTASEYGDFDTQWAAIEAMACYKRAEDRARAILADLEVLN